MNYNQGNLRNITGLLTDTELGVVNLGTLKYLKHKSVGLLFSASPTNPGVVKNAGTAIFRIQKFTQWKRYTAANREQLGDLVDNKIKISIDFNKDMVSKYEIETLELQKQDLRTREEYIAMIQQGISVTLVALLDARMLNLAVNHVKALRNQKASDNAQLVIPDIEDLNTANKRTDAYRAFARKTVDLERYVDDAHIGVNPDEFACFLHKHVIYDLQLAMPKGGNSATEIGKNLARMAGAYLIGGIIAKDHTFLGQKIKAGQSFDAENDYDFSNIYGLIVHNQALFVATNGLLTTASIGEKSGNQLYISKFSLGEGVVREQLFSLIVKNKIPLAN